MKSFLIEKLRDKMCTVPKLRDTNESRISQMSPEFLKIKKFCTPKTLI